MKAFNEIRVEQIHPHAWIWEPLETDATLMLRTMFGAKALYLEGKLMFCFVAKKEEPWSGILIATDREHHASLIAEIPFLTPHPVLTKWLYLSESSASFEHQAEYLVQLAKRRDKRIGVIPPLKKRKRVKALAKRPLPD